MTWDELPLFLRVILRGIGLTALFVIFIALIIAIALLAANYFGMWGIIVLAFWWIPFAMAYDIENN